MLFRFFVQPRGQFGQLRRLFPEIFWRFEDRETNEAQKGHDYSDTTHAYHKVSPAHVFGPCANNILLAS